MPKKEYRTLEELLQKDVFQFFYQISQIPHGSFKEKELSDFLVGWGKERNLSVLQDKNWNVIIKKNSTKGYEQKSPLLLQAHIDMVCEKSPGVSHDFDKGPIPIQLEGDLLTTGGKTTLGADNGIGVALIMAVLASDNLSHPPLEALFTTAEEEDMSGALNVDASLLSAKRGINLDHSVENQLIAGSSGGMGATLILPITKVDVTADFIPYKITLSGLTGGHSGEDIHRGRGNAIILLARLLLELSTKISFYLGDFTGGNFRLAIPREAEAVLLLCKDDIPLMNTMTTTFLQEIQQEYAPFVKDIVLKSQTVSFSKQAIAPNGVELFLFTLILLPNGIQENNASVGTVDSSCNIGEVRTKQTEIEVVMEIRAAHVSARDYTYQKIQATASLVGAVSSCFAKYPGWSYQPESALRNVIREISERIYGSPTEVLVLHCGLECGCLCEKTPGLDIVSMGPNHWGLHSPTERLSISSTKRFYSVLCDVLEAL